MHKDIYALEDYLLYLKSVKKRASNGVGTVVYGSIFYRHVLGKEENRGNINIFFVNAMLNQVQIF
jgi:hypothetical protein